MGIFTQLKCDSGQRVIPFTTPHTLWVEFMCEFIDNSKYGNSDVVEMFVYHLYRTLPLSVNVRSFMTRQVEGIRVKPFLIQTNTQLK